MTQIGQNQTFNAAAHFHEKHVFASIAWPYFDGTDTYIGVVFTLHRSRFSGSRVLSS